MPSRKYPSVTRVCYGALFFALAAMESGPMTCTAVAGDLLRGGYTTAPSGTTVPGSFTPPSVLKERQNAADLLAQTTRAIQSVTSMQVAARKLALSGGNNLGINPNNPSQTLPNVPNGLTAGGLVPSSTVAWTGISGQPSETVTSGGNTIVNIVQTSADAVLTWSSFNIGKNTTLDFNQSAGGANVSSWIAFNIIRDPTAVPSQILGSIEAPGQVYVINQNGIIFGGSSQVNVHTLVASSLPVDTFLITNGLLDNPDEQFLFSSIAQPAGSNGPSPAFTPPTSFLNNNVDGAVTVEAGAEITAPASTSNVGGRVALIGPNVTNDGTIDTPDGQTILAAGLQVGFVAHPSSDPTLRGLDVYVGAEVDPTSAAAPYAGTAINDGMIYAPGADVMITGKTVDQLGDILSTTSVTLNGRIDLLADYDDVSSNGVNVTAGGAPFLQTETGTVILGADSVSEIVPDLSSNATVVGTQLALSSQVNVQGKAINMADEAVVNAPDGTVNFNAGFWSYAPSTSDPTTQFVYNGGQIYLNPGATISVAGSEDVSASVLQNIITVQLRGAELAESPLERSSVLEGQNLVIDISQTGIYDGQEWVGTPLGNVFGYLGLIQRSVGELTANGGTVNLDAGGSVVTQPGSTIDVSGGWIDYAGAEVETTRLSSGGLVTTSPTQRRI
jgi:filamentous hemagglutinin